MREYITFGGAINDVLFQACNKSYISLVFRAHASTPDRSDLTRFRKCENKRRMSWTLHSGMISARIIVLKAWIRQYSSFAEIIFKKGKLK